MLRNMGMLQSLGSRGKGVPEAMSSVIHPEASSEAVFLLREEGIDPNLGQVMEGTGTHLSMHDVLIEPALAEALGLNRLRRAAHAVLKHRCGARCGSAALLASCNCRHATKELQAETLGTPPGPGGSYRPGT